MGTEPAVVYVTTRLVRLHTWLSGSIHYALGGSRISYDSESLWSNCAVAGGAVVYFGGPLCETVSVAYVPDAPDSSSFAFRLRVMGVVTLAVVAAKVITLVAVL